MRLFRYVYRLEATGRFITKTEYKRLPKHMTIKSKLWFWQEPKRGG